jgi:hypothetical protein
MSLTLAWGTQSGPPLGGLKLVPVDDAGLDAELLARDATAVVALYAASLTPFSALRRSGPFLSADALTQAMDGCDQVAGLMLLVRSWPLAIGAVSAVKPGAPTPLAAVQQSLGTLRNVVVALRDLTQVGPRFAITATFDAAARATIELFLTASAQNGSPGAATTIGKRSPTVYPMQLPGFPRQLQAAIESLASGRIGLTVADSEDSLTWAYRTNGVPSSVSPPPGPNEWPPPSGGRSGDPSGGKAKPPLLRVAADMAALAKLGPLVSLGREDQQILDMLARLRRVDGELAADGDLFRLTLHAPLKQ